MWLFPTKLSQKFAVKPTIFVYKMASKSSCLTLWICRILSITGSLSLISWFHEIFRGWACISRHFYRKKIHTTQLTLYLVKLHCKRGTEHFSTGLTSATTDPLSWNNRVTRLGMILATFKKCHVEISWFSYHSDFTWNQFQRFLKF